MVRLKEFKAYFGEAFFCLFQFLMVRLKAVPRPRIVPASEFQFLMVRLKAFSGPMPRNFFVFQFLMVRLKACAVSCQVVLLVFQFLMVRLKVCSQPCIHRINRISIPYGSIKSLLPTLHSPHQPYFNSLWFD